MAKKNDSTLKKIDTKQIIVACVILLVAVLLLMYSFLDFTENQEKTESKANVEKTTAEITTETKETQEVVAQVEKEIIKSIVKFTSNTENDCLFQVYYTTEEGEEFSEEKSVKYQGTKGEHTYEIEIPVKDVMHIRLDFSQGQGKASLKDFYIIGEKEIDLNDVVQYTMFQFNKINIEGTGGITFETLDDSSYIVYDKNLMETNQEVQENQTVNEENAETVEGVSEEQAPLTEGENEKPVTSEENKTASESGEIKEDTPTN